jgi:glucokinase
LGRDQVLNNMCDAIQQTSEKYKARANLLGVGIGVPGIMDKQTGMMRESPNLPGWADYPVRAEIERRLGTPVILENDANCAAFGEKWLGAGRLVRDLAMLTLGTGVGGGIVMDGKIWHGMTGMAGEFTHDGRTGRTAVWLRESGLPGQYIRRCRRAHGTRGHRRWRSTRLAECELEMWN